MQNEQLTTDDFAPIDSSVQHPHPMSYSLIQLMLPFAEASKSTANADGMFPFQLAESVEGIASLLRPATFHVNSNQSSVTSGHPITASQLQGGMFSADGSSTTGRNRDLLMHQNSHTRVSS